MSKVFSSGERAPGVVTADGKFVVVPLERRVNVYDAVTGRKTKSLLGHTNTVTAVARHPHNTHQVFTASLDGTIRLWDFADGFIAKQIDTQKPVTSMVVPYRQDILYFQNEIDSKDLAFSTRRLDLSTWSIGLESLRTKSFSPLVSSNDGSLVGVADTRKLLVWPSKTGWKNALKLHHTKNFTCMAIDSTEGRVAGGDATGRILIWNDLKTGLANAVEGSEHNMPCTTVHWHSQAVHSLAFSLDSAYLLSGGSEGVLVAWQLGTNAKRMLPRLSSILLGIHPFRNDAALYLVTQKDNTVRKINLASMKVELSISGIKPAPKTLPDHPAHHVAVAMLPGGGQLAIAAENSVIQFYDAARDRQLEKLQVRPVNVTSPAESDSPAEDWSDIEPQVTRIAFNSDATCMATIDVRADASTSKSYTSSLRIWDRRESGDAASGTPLYHVQTQIDNPHRGKVTGLAFHPSEGLVATAGADGKLHFWRSSQEVKQRQWQCEGTSSYQGRPISSVAFSADGSMLAAGCGSVVGLWNVNTGQLIDTLDFHHNEVTHIDHLTFVPGTPFLAGGVYGSRKRLVVWNLLLKALWWSQNVSVACLTADGLGTGVIAAGFKPHGGYKQKGTGAAAVFHVSSPHPVQVWAIPRTWASGVFFPDPSSHLFVMGKDSAPEGTHPLLIFTHDRKITLGARSGCEIPDFQDQQDVEMKDVESEMKELSAYASKPTIESTQRASLQTTDRLDVRARVADLFDAPTHILPSIESLAPAFLELLVCKPD